MSKSAHNAYEHAASGASARVTNATLGGCSGYAPRHTNEQFELDPNNPHCECGLPSLDHVHQYCPYCDCIVHADGDLYTTELMLCPECECHAEATDLS